MEKQYELGFRAHHCTHAKQYRKIGHFEGRMLAKIDGRTYDVEDLKGMGYTPLQLALV